jgi:hypothetical protein
VIVQEGENLHTSSRNLSFRLLLLEMSIVMKFKLLTCGDNIHFNPTAEVTCEIGSAHHKGANLI